MDHKVSFEQRPVLYEVQNWVMADIVRTSSYVTPQIPQWTTPSETASSFRGSG